MQQTDDRLQHIAQVTADAIAREYNLRYGDKIPVPVQISFELELINPKHAGAALTHFEFNSKGHRRITGQELKLNMTLYRDNVREFLNKVIPHELAHLDQQWKNIRSGSDSIDHGYVWQASMRAMSQVPVAKHRMDLTKAIAVHKEHKAKAKKAKKEAKA